MEAGGGPVGDRVGIFDSGVGGLSVWREIVRQHPGVDTLYVADQAHIPYGARSAAEILGFSRGITRYLLARGCTAIVVACNSASAAALQHLRHEFSPGTFVGMEPAVKPAALASQHKVVGVLGTPTTLAGELFQRTIARHAAELRLLCEPCPGLVESIEAGTLEGPELERSLRTFLRAPLEAGADVLVLACTHYPLVRSVIEKVAGPEVQVIDPAPAVARQLGRWLERREPGTTTAPQHEFRTTGDVDAFARVTRTILGQVVHVAALRWEQEALHEVGTPVGRKV